MTNVKEEKERGTLSKIEPCGQTILMEVVPYKTKFGELDVAKDKTRCLIGKLLKLGPDVPPFLRRKRQRRYLWLNRPYNAEGRNIVISTYHGIPIDFPEAEISDERFKLIVPDEIISFWNAED